ncbi:hypothetical protein K474DRAFT_1702422 [Panus rudis PR-1116 ss-1]|nr:hypothetical protein K474DRAFT_1702422 [Panus rudis PR-1116 ss-1]
MSKDNKDIRSSKRTAAPNFIPDGFAVAKKRKVSTKDIPRYTFESAFDVAPESSSSSSNHTGARIPQEKGTSRRSALALPKDARQELPSMPDFSDTAKKPSKAATKKLFPMTALRPMLPSVDSPDQASPITSGVRLTSLIPPPLPTDVSLSTSKSKRNLRPLSKLPKPVLPTRDLSKMKTITTTRVALLTNPMTEDGAMNLFAIYAAEHAHEYIRPTDREVQRGLLQSPEKASKKGKQKYIPGGLAYAARNIIHTSRNGLTLFKTQQRLQLERHRGLFPHLRLRIKHIFYATPPHKQPHALSSRPPIHTIARTKVEFKNAKELRGRTESRAIQQGQELIVLFRMDPPNGDPPEPLNLDQEVWVWRPWICMEVPFGYSDDDMEGEDILFCSRYYVPT